MKSNPEYFNSFEKIFLDIISDNKINPSDIPNLLLLLKKLYEILFNINSKGISIDTYKSILKFIVDIIVTEKVSDVQKRQELLSLVHILIDTSCELITFRQVLKSNKPSIFSSFCSLFFSKDESKSDTKDEHTSDAKDEAKSEAKDEPKTDAKDEHKTDAKDEPKSEAKDEPKSEAKDEAMTDAKDELKTDAKDEPTSDAKDEPKTDIVIGEEAKSD